MYTQKQLSEAVASFLANNPSDVAEAIGLAGTVSTDIGVKPLYWHCVTMFGGESGKNSVQFNMVMQSSEPINTLAKLKAWIESISGSVILACNGCIEVSETSYPIHAIVKTSSNTYMGYYISPTNGSTQISSFDFNAYFSSYGDQVYRLN